MTGKGGMAESSGKLAAPPKTLLQRTGSETLGAKATIEWRGGITTGTNKRPTEKLGQKGWGMRCPRDFEKLQPSPGSLVRSRQPGPQEIPTRNPLLGLGLSQPSTWHTGAGRCLAPCLP